ncbi:MAG: HNH endonuclease [Bacillota bacterium]|nr:HNH endonuclease [Bacillota bacterium]
MQITELKEKLSKIKMWQRGGERAPHKPLLLLYALGRLARGEPRLMSYAQVKDDLKNLLVEFGPYRQNHSPSYPFIRLTNDGIWGINGLDALNTNKNWSDRELEVNETEGGFTESVFNLFKNNPTLVRETATDVLRKNFPDTIHQDILDQVGLNLEISEAIVQADEAGNKLSRSTDFRNRVLGAYEYRCAVCGFNVRLGSVLVAIEAAHIKWHQAGGPDLEQNGIALCSLHHKLFDRGVFTLSEGLVFQVAENAHGTHGMDEWLMRYHGQEIRKPQRPNYYPQDSFINWHMREVFRGPARYTE